MAVATCPPRPATAAPPVGDARAAHRGEPTLDALVSSVWEGLAGPPHAAACPVCGGALEARFGAGARPVGGACADCGAQLS